ncbi:MAG: ATP-binding cassette domain-containing protein [Flavipsychrobacter sp.]
MSTNVLANINLVIPYNKVTAIVGTSGGGKSTFVKLLMGSYMPTSGEILINDKINLRKINLKEWRNTFGVVMQEGFLFNDSFLGNIAVGEDLPNLDKVINAAKIANIHSHIMTTPREYRTKIGNEGVPISTGEKQRVLIARAIYKNPDILFLDEATSSLDANNEKDIMEKLNDFYSNKTVVVIAHRLSTIKNADNIVVLDKGEIVEQGSHNELIKQGGYYFRLVDKQL